MTLKSSIKRRQRLKKRKRKARLTILTKVTITPDRIKNKTDMRDGSVVVPQYFYGDKTMKLSKLASTLTPYTAGEQPKEKTVKLNTNENPYPPSPAVERALRGFDTAKYRLYPDPTASGLRRAIAEYEDVNTENVFVGNGSDEVLSFAFAAFYGGEDKPVLFADVTYSFYKVFGSLYGVNYRELPLTADMRLDIKSMIGHADDSCGCVFANPNAPFMEERAARAVRIRA